MDEIFEEHDTAARRWNDVAACNDAESGVVNGPHDAEVLCRGDRLARRYAHDAGPQNKPEGGRGRVGVRDDDEHEAEQEGGEVNPAG